MSMRILDERRSDLERHFASIGDPETRTKQSEAAACEIRNIMKQYRSNGVLPKFDLGQGSYGDFSTTIDMQQALQASVDVEIAFLELPSGFRAELGNDPANLIDWLNDERNRPRAEELGIVAQTPHDPISLPPNGVEPGEAEPGASEARVDKDQSPT
ncbi:internal scaffolding protein [Microviridae sp.]|nr:internal scaffolding protein [Microviridae sp.]